MKKIYDYASILIIVTTTCGLNAKNIAEFDLCLQQQPLPGVVAAAYHSVSLTGFNHDVVANGSGQANATTTETIDYSNEYYSADFVPSTPYNGASAAAVGGGLPANGQVQSAVTSGLTYQLSDYNAPNALLLRPLTTASGMLNFASGYTANSVYILWVATEAQANNVGVTIHFADGTTQVSNNQIAYDWVGGNTGIALSGLGRIGAGVTQWAQLNEFSELGACKLFEKKIDILAENQSKTITGVSFNYAPSGDYQSLAVFAINVFGESLGVASFNRNSATVYPNPSSGKFNVATDRPIRTITVFDAIGREITSGKGAEISLGNVPNGIYYLKIESETGASQTIKVLKN
ncbi:T9SS type A sorting domain-containing protein [Flavobacterium selenitireducens]|uniref:T9SS type A sorting domain-containing protein n=1 Tax=Flavobacterium selenitireducens TaxID=2722704 RepID=UPI00168B834B|nr:T9SS type A sorting domain-containing protein [Flavobacterium selenitireducens]MBD3580875.1 T9SS type A sorting domain-containing protein [Flavobacterium selenitireducens]